MLYIYSLVTLIIAEFKYSGNEHSSIIAKLYTQLHYVLYSKQTWINTRNEWNGIFKYSKPWVTEAWINGVCTVLFVGYHSLSWSCDIQWFSLQVIIKLPSSDPAAKPRQPTPMATKPGNTTTIATSGQAAGRKVVKTGGKGKVTGRTAGGAWKWWQFEVVFAVIGSYVDSVWHRTGSSLKSRSVGVF